MIRFFAGHPTAANLIMGAILLLGALALPTLTRETFPRIAPREVEARVAYPGAGAEDVARELCGRLEDAFDRLQGLAETRCDAREGLAIAVAEMRRGGDIEGFFADVRTEVEAIDDFPDTVERATIRRLGRTDFVASVAVTGAEDATVLKALTEAVKEALLRAGAAPQATVRGFSTPEVRIAVRPEAARALGLSASDLARRLAAENIDLPAGELLTADGATVLRVAAQRRSAEAFGDVVVAASPTGGIVRLGDIATITPTFSEDWEKVEVDGRRAGLIDILKTPADDALSVLAAVEDVLAQERARAAPGVAMTVVSDRAGIVADRLALLGSNAAMGLALVFAAMWLVFGLRQAFWIALGLPVSFLGAFAAMAWFGLTLNMMTMLGLLIVVGILMDDAIVVSEAIATHAQRGLGALDAAVAGLAEVGPGVLSSFLTTVAVFGSLIFLDGNIGEILGVVPLVMILVLAVSLVEAFLILPHHLGHGAALAGPRRADRWIEGLRDRAVGPMVRWAVRRPLLTLGLATGLLLASVALPVSGLVQLTPFPDLEGDQLEARLMLPPAATLADTEATVAQVVDALRGAVADSLDGPGVLRRVTVRFGENADAQAPGRHLATIAADLAPSGERLASNAALIAAWRAALPTDADFERLTMAEPTIGPQGRDIAVRLAHDDRAELAAATAALHAHYAAYVGVLDLGDDLLFGRPELEIALRPEAAALGLDAETVARQVRAAFRGETADQARIGGDTVDIVVEFDVWPDGPRAAFDALEIETPRGGRVPLPAVAEFREARGPLRIHRIDRRPTATLEGTVDPAVANAASIVAAATSDAYPALIAAHPGLSIGVEGASAEGARTRDSMLRGLLIGLAAVYALLAFQFRGWLAPVAVMAVIPFTVIGAMLGHLVIGAPFSLPSMLGLASLAGVVVNGSILLAAEMRRALATGATVEDAAAAAAARRFRAILLTTITTVVGVTPLLFETSLQAQVLIPMVTSIAFGLISATLLLLVVTPALLAVASGARVSTARPVPI